MSPVRKNSVEYDGYLGLADLHGKKNNPKYRIDDYKTTFITKLDWAINYANEHNLLILIAGDMFESVREGLELLNLVLAVLMKAKHTPIAVAGQHDLMFHTKNMYETPIYNLALAGALRIASATPIDNIYGAGFEEEVPEPEGDDAILLIHRCITPKEPPFFLPDAISAKEAKKKYSKYEYIVSGDYHEPFVSHADDGPTIINCGPILRNSKSLIDHRPRAYQIITGNISKVYIPIAAPEKVFNIGAISFDEKHGMTLDLTRIQELMGTEYAVRDFEELTWMSYNEYKKKDECVVKESSVKKALNGEPIWVT